MNVNVEIWKCENEDKNYEADSIDAIKLLFLVATATV